MILLKPYRSYYIKTNYWSNLAAVHVLDLTSPFAKVFMFGNPNRVHKIKLCDITEIIPYTNIPIVYARG